MDNNIYLVCEKLFVNGIMVDHYVLKAYKNLDNAKDRLNKEAEMLVMGDNKWRKTDTNGSNFIEMSQYDTIRRYYIVERFIED